MRASRLVPFAFCCLSVLPALAGPRDAGAILNRCGKPHKSDQTILENTVAGGRRILTYQRGVLNFERVQNDGWTFTSGAHGSLKNLSAAQMEQYMPCLHDAFLQSASPEPLKRYTPVTRVEASMKERLGTVILYCIGALAVIGVLLFGMSRRPSPEEETA